MNSVELQGKIGEALCGYEILSTRYKIMTSRKPLVTRKGRWNGR